MLNNDIKIQIFPIETSSIDNKNKDKRITKLQNVIVIGTDEMLSLLNYKNYTQFELDTTFKIIPKSFKNYKLMTIYSIENKTNIPKLAALVCIRYVDSLSLKLLFGYLRVTFNFSPKFITTDYNFSQIKALKECETFNKKPYVVCCLFHYSQCIIKKMKKLGIMKKSLNRRAYTILRNLELLCFIIVI